MISLITNEEKLFEPFNRRIICMRIENNEAYDFESMKEDALRNYKNLIYIRFKYKYYALWKCC